MGHVRMGPVGVSPIYSHPKPAIQSGRPPSLRSLQTMTVATAGHTILSTQRGLSPSYTAEGLKMGGEDRKTDGVPQSVHKTRQSTAVAGGAVQMPSWVHSERAPATGEKVLFKGVLLMSQVSTMRPELRAECSEGMFELQLIGCTCPERALTVASISSQMQFCFFVFSF